MSERRMVWVCSGCMEALEDGTVTPDPAWRWNGDAWEHRCQGAHPQVGHNLAVKVSAEWVEDCLMFWGRVLLGEDGHWCNDWDGLPVDETCCEYECCTCEPQRPDLKEKLRIYLETHCRICGDQAPITDGYCPKCKLISERHEQPSW